jgi:hypothetical protein
MPLQPVRNHHCVHFAFLLTNVAVGDDVAGLWRSLCDICGAAVSPSNPHPIEFLTQVVVSATVILLQLARENMAHGHSIFVRCSCPPFTCRQ